MTSIWEAVKDDERTDKIGGALRRAAQMRKELTELAQRIVQTHERIQELEAECRGVGVDLTFQLEPALGAAFRSVRRGDTSEDTRVSFDMDEAPVIPIEELAENREREQAAS